MRKYLRGLLPVVFCGALASLAIGCGAASEGAEGELGVSTDALSYGAWQTLTGMPFGQFGPTLAVKKQGATSTGTVWWAMPVPYDNTIARRVNSSGAWFGGWSTLSGVSSVSSKPAAVSWLGPSGVGFEKNLALAWTDYSGVLRFGVADYQQGVVSTWTSMSAANFTFGQPALAYTNGYVYLFTRQSSDNQIAFRRATASSSGTIGSWTAWTTVPWSSSSVATAFGNGVYGFAAAAVSSNKISLIASPISGGIACLRAVATVSGTGTTFNTANVDGWAQLNGCTQPGYASPSMTATGSGGISGARVVIGSSGGGFTTSTSINGTTWSSFGPLSMDGCTATSSPSLVEHTTTGKLLLATTCSSGGEVMYFREITTP